MAQAQVDVAIGVQLSPNAFIANCYPTTLRGTRIGGSVTIGRLGSLSGPLVGGLTVARGSSPAAMFMIGAATLLCAGSSLVAFVRSSSKQIQYAAPGGATTNKRPRTA